MKRFLICALTTCALAMPVQAQRLVPPADIPVVAQQVQATESYRVIELEETVRRLNGKVEELNFLLLQLQEKLRKMEEDNESRFQEIEDKQSSVADPNKDVAQVDNAGGEARLGKPDASGDTNSASDEKRDETKVTAKRPPKIAIVKPAKPRRVTKLEPRALGTLTFDKDGNVVDGEIGSGSNIILNPFKDGSAGSLEASEFGTTPNEVFAVARKALGARKYPRAQQAFNAHIIAWPKDPRSGEARYYLGEALFWQKKYFKSAEIHLEAHNEYPNAKTAADNLLGLGLALAGLNQREVACATYAEVLQQYPDAKSRLAERVKDEQAAARC